MVLFGPSGSGKTITLQSVAGLITPDSGRIALNDRVLFDSKSRINIPSRHRGIGYLFQDYALFPHLTVLENVGFGLKKSWQWRLSQAGPGVEIEEFLEIFEIAHLANSFPLIFPEVKSSALHWREHSSASRTSCSWMSLSPLWIRSCV